MRLIHPWRQKLRAEGCDQQHGQALDMPDEEIEQLLRGRIDPVQVFKGHQHWFLLRQASELPLQRFESLLLPRSRIEFNGRIASGRQQ